MGDAKRRGTREERVEEAMRAQVVKARQAAEKRHAARVAQLERDRLDPKSKSRRVRAGQTLVAALGTAIATLGFRATLPIEYGAAAEAPRSRGKRR